AGVARGCYPEALGQEEQWISVRISQHRNPKGPVEVKREDGLWLLIDEQEMPDGGIVSIATDVTVQKAAEEALRASEIRFRQHASATSDWLWETDAERRYTYISDVMEDKLGRRVQQYLGTTVDTNIEDVYKRAEWQPFFDAFEARQPFRDLTVKRRDPDGTEQWIRTSGVPFFDVDGDFLGYRGSSSDVTEYVEAEQRLANLTTAINRKNEIVILYDADDRLVFCNDAFRDFNTDIADLIRPGVTFEELTRASLERGLITEALGREEDWLQQRLERHRNPEGPVELERHGGVWQLIQEQCLEDGSVVSIVLDITDRKRAEEALHDNERQLRLITDAVPAVIIYFDADLRFQFVNKTAESWYDRPAAELIGRTSAEVVGTKRAATASARLEAALAGAPQEYEARHTYPDGQIRDVNGTYVPHFNAAGHVVGIYTLVLDVTERKRAQDALRDSEQRFRTVFDHVPAAIALKDSQGRYELINKPYEEYFQNKAEAVLGKTSADFYPPEIAARLAENDRSVAKSKSVMTEDTKVTQPHLPMRHVRITKFPVFEQSGKVSGVGTIAINISAEKAAEERLIQSQKMEAVGQLTGGIAHEFNNLLQVVASYVGLLEEDLPLNAETKQAFDAINRNVTRGADLTDRLLSYSRQQPLAPRSLDVIDVLKEMQIMLRQTLGERIRVETAPLINIWPAEADPNQLENALLNLALNARDAMPDGGVIKLSAENIQLTAEDAAAREDTTPGDYVMLAVTDNGSGMTAESMNRAFEPF
ncbi:MAG: PAS domain-containing protein, partial [Candidatus Magasanikbacteria bacterium]|nr:PAS domain-containing protein [Candidatus Magasanikbacteria bacterium]